MSESRSTTPLQRFQAAALRFAEAHVHSDAMDARYDERDAEECAAEYDAADQEYNASKKALVEAYKALEHCANTHLSAELPSLRPEVIAFARAMQVKLDKNAKKKGWPEQDQHGDRGWKSCPPMFLEAKLREEFGELEEALLGSDKQAILHEAADIGNIAMMLADNAGALPSFAPSAIGQSVEAMREVLQQVASYRMGCRCTLKEIDSGHHVDCHVPEFQALQEFARSVIGTADSCAAPKPPFKFEERCPDGQKCGAITTGCLSGKCQRMPLNAPPSTRSKA